MNLNGIYSGGALTGLSPIMLSGLPFSYSLASSAQEEEVKKFLSPMINETLTKTGMYPVSQLLQGLDRKEPADLLTESE